MPQRFGKKGIIYGVPGYPRPHRDLPNIACVSRPVPHQVKAMSNIAAALRKCGLIVRETYDRVPSEEIVFVWSWKWSKEILDAHPDTLVCTLDHGLFAPRNQTVVTGWLGLNGWGIHPVVDDGGERWRGGEWRVKPPRKPGKYALVLGQCYNDVSILDHLTDYGTWLKETGDELRAEGWEVIFRPHPVQRRNDLDRYPRFAPITAGVRVEHDLEAYDVGCAVAFNSNALLECYMEGIQDIRVYNGGSMLWPACVPVPGKTYRKLDLARADRLMSRLAWCQWKPEEINEQSLWLEHHLPIMRRLVHEGPKVMEPWAETEVPCPLP